MGALPGVLLDRDGTLVREVGYLRELKQLEILPRVPEAVQLLSAQGLKVVVITNQSAVARGFLSEDELKRIHEELRHRLASRGAYLDGIYYCPHHPTEGLGGYGLSCECRKPNTGLAHRAAEDLSLDLKRCYVVGDQMIDMELAGRIGAKGIFISSGETAGKVRQTKRAPVVVEDLWEAACWIVRDLKGG